MNGKISLSVDRLVLLYFLLVANWALADYLVPPVIHSIWARDSLIVFQTLVAVYLFSDKIK